MVARRLIGVLLILSLVPSLVRAQSNRSDWANVQRLSIGSSIVVSTKRGDAYVGRLQNVTSDSLSLLVTMSQSAQQVFDLRKDEVREVRKSKSRLVKTIIGLAVGTGIGVGIGAAVDAGSRSHEDPGLATALGGLLGGLFGAATGAAVPIKGKKIYVAP